MSKRYGSPEERFWRCVRKSEGCWIWIGYASKEGYGRMWIDDVRVRAHRYSFEMHRGPIPENLRVLHRCDTPACVNPDHLFLGTQADNVADKVRKGRQAKGERHPCSKMNEAKINAIRASSETVRDIGKRFGIAHSTVVDIRNGRIWNHIGVPMVAATWTAE